MPVPRISSIFIDRSPDEPVCQHFLTWGMYETVVQKAATRPTSVSSVNMATECRGAGGVPAWPAGHAARCQGRGLKIIAKVLREPVVFQDLAPDRPSAP